MGEGGSQELGYKGEQTRTHGAGAQGEGVWREASPRSMSDGRGLPDPGKGAGFQACQSQETGGPSGRAQLAQ